MASKSSFITYILWFVGGLFGLHHFYLNRDYHALIYFVSFGGYFGGGWLRDLWKIPEYVKDANEDPLYMQQLAKKILKNENPPTGYVRCFAQMLIANVFGYLIFNAIPKELFHEQVIQVIAALCAPFACALGVYLVGNVGRHKGKLKLAALAAYITSPLYFMMDPPIFLSSLLATISFNFYCKEWRRTPSPKKSLTQRLLFLTACGTLYLLLWSSWLYFNCTVTVENDELETENSIKCRDAAKHFFKSPILQEFASVMRELWRVIKVHGFREVWNEIVSAFDPVGEINALKILGLNKNATQQEITSRYRKLSREWHPDKHKDAEAKKEAEEKFIDIQQAYEILSKIKSQRVAQNNKDQDFHPDEHEEL